MDIENVVHNFENWLKQQPNTTRLQRHEAMKAMIFAQGITEQNHPALEYKVFEYFTGRNGLLDYLDDDMAIEVDDGRNVKSFNKLVYARDNMGRRPLWILILESGKGGSARNMVKKYGIDMLRILARNNHFEYEIIEARK